MKNIEFSCSYGKDTLRKLQDRLLEMYEGMAAIFDANNIEHFIMYGTLLGACRHKGFIPWDDDFDICVMAKDYERGLRLLRENLSDRFFVMDKTYDINYPRHWAKVMDKYSKATDYCEANNEVMHWGISIDLFKCSIEKIGRFDRQERHNKHQKKNHFYKLKERRVKGLRKIRSLLILFVCYVRIWLYGLLSIFFKRNKTVCVIEPRDLLYPPEWFYPLKKTEFDGKPYFIPNQPELILTKLFGDWQTIPKEEDRVVHFADVKLF